ncbi:MAG: GntR family transcriptional regulator [Anaerolineaceae bacterium]|nr:GntR family transcriptional regulator [Anaerolineaceae bacterium]
MAEKPLYQNIFEKFRQDIIDGNLSPGDKLPPIRQLTQQWGCTPGTIQRAYRELAEHGLVSSRAGQGTKVIGNGKQTNNIAIRRAGLINKTEAFLIEAITAGFSPKDVEQAIKIALDRWRIIQETPRMLPETTIRFSGSHDLALKWLVSQFNENSKLHTLDLNFSGSLNGLFDLANGKADIAGIHLWDIETNSYNVPFLKKLMPGQEIVLITLAYRRIGLITAQGNPFNFQSFSDLKRPEVQFVNRQTGSGTRVWIDAILNDKKIDAKKIKGYEIEVSTHSQVAKAVAEGKANVGIGLQASANLYGLSFSCLREERYDLVILKNKLVFEPVKNLISILQEKTTREAINSIGGYLSEDTGKISHIIT